MIVLSAAPRSGKTTFCSNNSFSTLYDRIKSQSFFGSLGFTVAEGQYNLKRSNSTIKANDIPNCAILDRTDPPVDGEIVTLIIKNGKPGVSHLDHAETALFYPLDISKFAYLTEDVPTLLDIDTEFYIKRGALEPAYIKKDQYFYPVIDESHTAAYVLSNYAVSHIIYTGVWYKESLQGATILGIGIIDAAGQVAFAMIHGFFVNGVKFMGLPYINVAEAGPSAPSGYITTGHGQDSGDNLKFRRVFSIESRSFTGESVNNYAFLSALALAALRQGGLGVNLITGAIILSALPATINLINDVKAYFSKSNTNVGTNLPYDPTSFILTTNRAFFDSIIDVLYTSSGATLTGGIPSEVIRKFINTQLNESIGIYSSLGGSNDKDPFHSLATDAHMAGSYSFKHEDGWPSGLYFTTRNTNNRYQWYKLVDKKKIYANRLVIDVSNNTIDNPLSLGRIAKISTDDIYAEHDEIFQDQDSAKINKNRVFNNVQIRRLF